MGPREQEIIDAVSLHGSLEVACLATMLGVSDQTVRRLVKPLTERGLVKKVHGAVCSAHRFTDPPFQARLAEQAQAKQAIARAVVDLVEDGDSLMLDTGSTTAFIAQALRKRSKLAVLTNSTSIAATLASVPGNRVFMAGTELRNHDGASFDASAFAMAKRFSARLAVLSSAAVDAERGFLVQEHCEAEWANCLMEQSERCLFAVDHSKFGRMALVGLGDILTPGHLVTDRTPPPDFDGLLERAHLTTVVAVP